MEFNYISKKRVHVWQMTQLFQGLKISGHMKIRLCLTEICLLCVLHIAHQKCVMQEMMTNTQYVQLRLSMTA